MSVAATCLIPISWPLQWLTGPLFDKDLRVASRRRRGYVLRFAYVLILTLYIGAVWVPAVELVGRQAMSRAQMQVAAKTITMGIVWFQFFGAQAVAVVLMSTAISEEVHSRTLPVLMTPPLSSRQVVMNKFFSRLSQVLLLVATSLPLLALVRVLGGIPWGYLLVSLCVTMATVVFVGAVSLLFSALCKRTYIVVIVSALSVALLFVLVPLLSFVVLDNVLPEDAIVAMSSHLSPYFLLSQYTAHALVPRAGASAFVLPIVSCCGLLLGATAVVLIASARLVRSVALRRALGEPVLLDRLCRGRFREARVGESPTSPRRGLRRVVGPPMIWKEATCTLSSRQKFVTRMVVGLELLLILIAYLFPAMMSVVSYEALHVLYVCGFLGLAALLTLVAAAAIISTEKESRTWLLLLLTPLSDREILAGKFVGVLRRCGPAWLALLAYVVAFTYAGCFRPLAIAQVTIIILTVLLFLSATGFYFGSRLRRVTEAVTANLVCAGVLWCAVPIVAAVVEFGMRGIDICWSVAFMVVPFAQAFALVTTTLADDAGQVRWFGQYLGGADVTMWMCISMIGYLLVSLAFAWRAVRALRRHMV